MLLPLQGVLLLPIRTPKAMHLAMCSTSVGVVQKLHFGCLLMFVLRLHSDMEDVEATVYVTFQKAFARFYRNRQLVPLWCYNAFVAIYDMCLYGIAVLVMFNISLKVIGSVGMFIVQVVYHSAKGEITVNASFLICGVRFQSVKSYKQAYGYFPGVVSIDGIIAYIENRDGNTPVKFHQADTLSRAFKLLHSYGLHIGIFHADCGSYSEDVIRTVDGNCRIFYIRAIHSASMYSRIQDIREWRRFEIGSQETEVASVMSTQFMADS